MTLWISKLLLAISNALLLPVVGALLLLALLTLLYTGGLVREAIERRRMHTARAALVHAFKRTPTRRLERADLEPLRGLLRRGLEEALAAPHARDKVLDDLELRAERSVGRLAYGLRLGPMLGLAGTLIPLGPALVALSTGDIRTLSTQLVLAFGTTVLGLVIGGLSYVLHAIRSRWYTEDLSDVAFLSREER
ncbi:MAG: MotA/TolQ/ExbB proton channel family protein [Planctomycetota bacterium]|nr:MAG: MotA/TolQ/ExbB proton channel family protein [Planctomycetota bacterium]